MRLQVSTVRRLAQFPVVYANWWTAYWNWCSTRTRRQVPVDYRLRGGPVMKMLTGPADIRVLNEVFIDQDYKHPEFAFRPGARVLDIGAHKGSFTAWALRQVPDLRVACFEPNPSTFQLLSTNVRATLVNAAVGADRREDQLHEVLGSPGQSSISPSRAASRGPIAQVHDIDVITLTEALAYLDGTADFVKIDIEGAEYDLLLKTPRSDWDAIDRIALEFDLVSPTGDAKGSDLVERLQEYGYTVDVCRSDGPGLLFAWR